MKVKYKGDVPTHVDSVGSFNPGDVVNLPEGVAKNLVKTNPNFVRVREKKKPKKET